MVALIYDVLLLLAITAAFWRGGLEERWAATIKVVSAMTTWAVIDTEHAYRALDPPLVAIDVATLSAMLTIALRSRLFWPLWAAALQLLILVANFVPLLIGFWHPLAYAMNEQLWSWPLVALIGIMALRTSRPDEPEPSPGECPADQGSPAPIGAGGADRTVAPSRSRRNRSADEVAQWQPRASRNDRTGALQARTIPLGRATAAHQPDARRLFRRTGLGYASRSLCLPRAKRRPQRLKPLRRERRAGYDRAALDRAAGKERPSR